MSSGFYKKKFSKLIAIQRLITIFECFSKKQYLRYTSRDQKLNKYNILNQTIILKGGLR